MSQLNTSVSKELLYRRGEYLALRAANNGFYLCQTQQHIYTTTERFKIIWLSEKAKQAETFHLDYVDHSEFACIITHVRLSKMAKDTYKLPENQKERINRELQQLLNPEETEYEEDSDHGVTAKSWPKLQAEATSRVASSKAKGSKHKKLATKSKKTSAKIVLELKKKKIKEPKSEKSKKRKLTLEERANPNLLLIANPNVTVWEKNPLTDISENVPYVSSTAHSKLVFRAVAMNDMKLLQSLIDNIKNIDKVDYHYSLAVTETPIHRAVKDQNIKAIQLLVKEVFDRDEKKPARCHSARNLLKTIDTGRYNRRFLHIPAVRALSMSRGSKEGNNALTKDDRAPYTKEYISQYINYALSSGVSKKTIDSLLISSNNANSHHLVDGAVVHAIRNGHRKLAATLLEEREKRGGNSFNALAREVMQFETEDLKTSSLRELSIRKKSWDNCNITPLHCAAINPNTKYLQKLCSLLPECGIPDKNNRQPIHYAAACEGTGPLEYLMKRGVSPDESDSSGRTPLMIACETGRVHNVDFLLRQAKAKTDMLKKENVDGDDDDESLPSLIDKYGIGGINRPIQLPNRFHPRYNRSFHDPNGFQSYCPIHLAVTKNQLEVVKCLIKYGVDVKKMLSTGNNRITPLMIACSMGNIAIVKTLTKENACVEEKDKLRRTPLMHAVMNGQAHVASYLLSLGADPNQNDSSCNSCLHYAAAYGWYFCVKTLLEAGADPSKSNDWQVTPLGIAFLKGHLGIADVLLQQPDIDINFQDDQGKTLVAMACSSELTEGLADEVKYLVCEKGADVTISDVNNNTPLHHLAQNEIINHMDAVEAKEGLTQCLQIAKILLGKGAKGSEKNEEGVTPVMYAIEQGNVELARLLIEKGGEFSMTSNKNGQNVLHLMAQKCMSSDLSTLLNSMQRTIQKKKALGNMLYDMARAVDKKGYTPLLYACKAYRDWTGREPTNDADNDSDYARNSVSRKRKACKSIKRPAKITKVGRSSSAQKVDPTWNYGRKFLASLLDLCDTDQNDVVQEKFSLRETPKKEAGKYENPNEAKYTPWHFLVVASHEAPVKNRRGEVEDYSPVLNILFRHYIALNLDKYDLNGRTPLIMTLEEATERNQSCAKKLIDHGANLNLRSKVRSDCGNTPLCTAVANNCNLDVIQALLKADINMSCTKHQNTPLHHAVYYNRSRGDLLQVVEKLLKSGASVNAVNYKGRTPLHIAVSANAGDSDTTSELESYLIEKGANILAKDYRGRLPIHYAFTKVGNYHNTSPIDPIVMCTTLVEYMSHQMIDTADKRGQTPLHLAARRGAGVCCAVLVQKGCNINAKDKTGNTPLTLAATTGHESCAILLIQRNANINAAAIVLPHQKLCSKGGITDTDRGNDDESESSNNNDSDQDIEEKNKKENEDQERERKLPDSEDEEIQSKPNPWVWKVYRKKHPEPFRVPLFQVCVKNNWPSVLYMMLEVTDEANLTVTSTIEAALNTGQYNLALTLIKKFKDVRKFCETNRTTGRNLLHTLAAKVRTTVQQQLIIRVAQELLHRGIPVDSKDHYGCKPIHYAALNHSLPLIKFIREHVSNLDVNERDRFGRTPLAAAFWTLKEEAPPVYEELYDMGANLNDQYSFPDPILHFGNVPKDTRSAYEIEEEYMTEQKSVRCTPLIRAIQMQDFGMVKRLLKDGADSNAGDDLQRVPLVHAIRRNNIHLVKLLLNHSYNLRGTDISEVEWIEYNDIQNSSYGRDQCGKWQLASGYQTFSLFQARKVTANDEENEDYGHEESNAELEAKKAKAFNLKKDASNDIDLTRHKKFPNASGVKLTLVDQKGWSLIHHVVAPLEEATYDNVEMLKLLSDAGAPLAEKDITGLTPLDYALSQNALNLVKALQKLMGVNKGNLVKPTLHSQLFVSDGLVWTTPKPNFDADSDAIFKKIEDAWMEEEQSDTRPSPDGKLEMDVSGEVEMDTDQDVAYDVVLTKVDVQGNSGWGLFNFYIMQIVKHKAKDLWILFNRWGYIGDDGQFQRTPFNKREDAVKEFGKIFKAKTGNDWKNIKSFEAQPKKYRLVDPEDRRKRKSLRDIKLKLKSTVACSLPDDLRDLMKELMDPHMLQSEYDVSEVDSSMIPFSRMRKETIVRAVELLNTLRSVTEQLKLMKRKYLQSADHLEKYKEKFKEVINLSNQIYQLLPDRGYAFQNITVLHSPDHVQKYSNRLVSLSELELASRIITGAMYHRLDINPAEYVYRSIGATLRVMNPDEVETQYLLKYLSTRMNTSGCDRQIKRIETIFEVNRPGEQHRIDCLHLDNHKLLFHGTKASHLLSILHRGLLIAPPGALITGHLHGKGLYFADMFDKSVSYTSNSSHRSRNKYKYILICQVALGNTQVTQSKDELKLKSFDSRLVPGSRAPRSNADIKLRDGCILPLGDVIERKVKDQWWIPQYNEYIIFNADQVRIRYLVKFS